MAQTYNNLPQDNCQNAAVKYYSYNFLCLFLLSFILSACCQPKPINNCQQHIIQKFIAEHQDLLIPPSSGGIITSMAGFYSFQKFSTANNVYQSSIEVVGNCEFGSLYLGWMDINANLNPKWYHFRYTNCRGDITFQFKPEPNIASPPYPYYMSQQHNNFKVRPRPTGAWCEFNDYDAWYIPHWSPIIDGKHQFISEIHEYYNEGSSVEVINRLNDAKPQNGEDLEDRTLTGWETVTMRGIVQKADYPYGDLDIDHLKACKETYGGIPAEIHFPEKGADWDMYIRPDIDMKYLGSDAKPQEVGCEIEDWTLRDDQHYYRPLRGDYLQTAGKWVIDCGHAINDNFDNGFFTEIHPPEYMVSSQYINGVTIAKILGTGAFKNWNGSFIVWPGPRPSVHHKLAWELIDENKENMSLSITAIPAANPNHLVCTLNRTNGDALKIDDEGVVYQRCNVIYKARIRCFWRFINIAGSSTVKEVVSHFKGINWDRVALPRMKEVIDSVGFLSVPGIITPKQANYFAKVRYRIIGTASVKNLWKEAIATNASFNLNLQVGQTYDIIPVSPQYTFHPDHLTVTVNENMINRKDTVRLSLRPAAGPRYTINQLLKKHSTPNTVNASLNNIMGRIFTEQDEAGIAGIIMMNQTINPNGAPIWGANLKIKTAYVTDTQQLHHLAAPFQIIGKEKDQRSFSYFDGKLSPLKKGTSVRLIFYRGTDENGYRLQFESRGVVNDEGRIAFEYKPAGDYFAGRIVAQLEEPKDSAGISYGIISRWIETDPLSDITRSKQDSVTIYSSMKGSERFRELMSDVKEFSAVLQLQSSTNIHLFKPRSRKIKEVKPVK